MMKRIAQRNMTMSAASMLINATFISTVLAGCQSGRSATPDRPVDQAPIAAPAPDVEDHGTHQQSTSPAHVRSSATVGGITTLLLDGAHELHPGDAIHVRDGHQVIATALVLEAAPDRTTARVVALTDHRRPVEPADTVVLVPLNELMAVPASPSPATESRGDNHETGDADAITPPLGGDAQPAHTLGSGDQPEGNTSIASTPAAQEPVQPESRSTAQPEVVAEDHTTQASPASLQPEVRARLEAERAYWELAARILRLPAGGPELTLLQQRLRDELVAQGAAR